MSPANGSVTPSATPRLTPPPVSGERTSISAPNNIATTPPIPRTPWLVYFASRMNSNTASAISRTPVAFTGNTRMP